MPAVDRPPSVARPPGAVVTRGPYGAAAASEAGRVSYNTRDRSYRVAGRRWDIRCSGAIRVAWDRGHMAEHFRVRRGCHDGEGAAHTSWIRGVAEGGVMHEAWRCDCDAAGRARTDERGEPAPTATTAAERRRAAIAAAALGRARRSERAAAYYCGRVPSSPRSF